ncbi:hypothetical protein [Calothrix sp. PCC 6303]|uniref:hypothetical protein n=1 Tax=Calothrix sp. PCC 6303 TaxID=1170562 RepID=UPI0002A046F2|nr:hypothetical protein [Calothrix sp. PCC 6303]AFZ01618.1 hypothetical protein Cal6303_2645 [Calothrix sp. PCC 6303]
MGNVNGSENKNSCTRAEEKRSLNNADSRQSGLFRRSSCNTGHKQKRVSRKDDSRTKNFGGDSTAGGMLRHLISNYREQVAQKDLEIQVALEEKIKLETKIKELESLRIELETASPE